MWVLTQPTSVEAVVKSHLRVKFWTPDRKKTPNKACVEHAKWGTHLGLPPPPP